MQIKQLVTRCFDPSRVFFKGNTAILALKLQATEHLFAGFAKRVTYKFTQELVLLASHSY